MVQKTDLKLHSLLWTDEKWSKNPNGEQLFYRASNVCTSSLPNVQQGGSSQMLWVGVSMHATDHGLRLMASINS
jgi:hypothetical protein